MRTSKVVILGGGTGQSRVIRALKDDIEHLSAVVTMADDGGSTGRLRKYHNAPAVGDVRQCLNAFSAKGNLWAKLFPYRFGNNRWGHGAQDIEGHVTGNILLVAMVDILGGLRPAIAAAAKEMGIKQNHGVFPSTFENVVLHAKLRNNGVIVGQYNISHKVPREKKFRIEQVWLESQPKQKRVIRANPDAVAKIKQADIIFIGPGALHGSVLPNLLIPDIAKAVITSKARKIYIANIAVKLSETRGFTLEDHIKSLISHTSPKIFDSVLVNNKQVKHPRGVAFLKPPGNKIADFKILTADLIDNKDIFNHDPAKLRRVLLEIIKKIR